MAEEPIQGDRITLELHMRKTSFCVGIEEGRWKVLRYSFPYLEVGVIGRGPSGNRHEMVFQLECRGFSAIGPFVQHWDHEAGRRPTPPGGDTTAPSVVDALKEWSETAGIYGGIYRPWQRGAAPHNNWAQLRPDLAWHSKRDLTFIMEQLYVLVSEQAAWLDYRAAA